MTEDPNIIAMLDKMREILVRKAHDYAQDKNRYSNFEFAGWMLKWAVDSGVTGESLSFLSPIATKLARIIELVGANKAANNESLEDSFVDLANYALLWANYLKRQNLPLCPYPEFHKTCITCIGGHCPCPGTLEVCQVSSRGEICQRDLDLLDLPKTPVVKEIPKGQPVCTCKWCEYCRAGHCYCNSSSCPHYVVGGTCSNPYFKGHVDRNLDTWDD